MRAGGLGVATPATGQSSPCGWKRATAPGAATSPATTPRSRLASASPSSSGPTSPSRGATRWRRKLKLKKRLGCFTIDDEAIVLNGRETIYRDGARAGYLASGGWGYTVGTNIGYGYVRNPEGVDEDYLTSGTYEIEVAGRRTPCTLHLRPLYDPEMARVKG